MCVTGCESVILAESTCKNVCDDVCKSFFCVCEHVRLCARVSVKVYLKVCGIV